MSAGSSATSEGQQSPVQGHGRLLAPELSAVLARLPHGEPFRFVSELTELTPGVAGRGAWDVGGDEDFLRGHFPPPGHRIVPGVLIAEALAQLCGLVAFAGEGIGGAGPALPNVSPTSEPARLSQVDVKILGAVMPPARIELSSTLVREMGPLVMFEVEALAGGSPAARGRIVLVRGGMVETTPAKAGQTATGRSE